MLKVFRNIAAGLFALIALLVLLAGPVLSYACKSSAYTHEGLIVITSIVLLFLLLWLFSSHVISLNEKHFDLILNIASISLFLVQLCFVYLAWFRTGWDVWWLTAATAEDGVISYLSRCPNQIVLYTFISQVRRMCDGIGLDHYLVLVILSCICCNVSLRLIVRVARELFGDVAAVATLAIGFIFIGLSPWILVPYSDTFSMPFTVGVLYWASCCRDSKYRLPVIVLLTGIGYLIKPTVIFALLSLILAALFSLERISDFRLLIRSLVPNVLVALLVCMALLIAFGIKAGCERSISNLDSSASQGMTHFLYMGANQDAGGVYNVEDVEFSESYTVPSDRTRAEADGWKQRIGSMGAAGTASLMLKKTLTNFADGMFGWMHEGDFFFQFEGHSSLGASLIGARGETKLYQVFQLVSQVIWLTLLLGIPLGVIRRKASVGEAAAYFSIAMLAVFLLVFEARGRYLILYLPYFVMLGVAGLTSLGRKFREFRLRHGIFGCMPDTTR